MTEKDTKKPRRKQTELAGFERPAENPAVVAAAQAYCEVRDARSVLSKKESQAHMNLIAVMHAEKVARLKFLDDNGEELEVVLELGKEKAVVRKTGEAESEIGEGVDTGDGTDVLAQSARAQADAGVAENDEGDVVPTDDVRPAKPAKKARGRGAKKARP